MRGTDDARERMARQKIGQLSLKLLFLALTPKTSTNDSKNDLYARATGPILTN